MIPGNNISQFIHTQAAVCIAVVSKTNITLILYHKLLQTTYMC